MRIFSVPEILIPDAYGAKKRRQKIVNLWCRFLHPCIYQPAEAWLIDIQHIFQFNCVLSGGIWSTVETLEEHRRDEVSRQATDNDRQ